MNFLQTIGYLFGDTSEHFTRTRATLVFIFGFWMLDLANNTVQGPARALLADLSSRICLFYMLSLFTFSTITMWIRDFHLVLNTFLILMKHHDTIIFLLLGPDQHNVVNAIFCSWMAVGNILGYSAGASGKWNR
ncbi:hypothetical protein Ahy_B03g064360 [Arachis hypogaea]|uniref:Uncharacterized protein n=1 Tax=Arachis hypogaea TaxID=3818 RepID=A0A444ZZF2_ARAHY|nr:hypothetical protein Ahy_B03g064360 [Arachis hypogaea]